MIEVKTQCGNCSEWIPKDSEKCPECGVHQKVKRKAQRFDEGPALSDGRCDWNIDGSRCRYPATWSPSTKGGGPYYCTMHAQVTSVPAGAQIVQASKDYVRLSVEQSSELDLQRRQTEAAEYCAAKGLETVTQMRAFVRTNIRTHAKPGTAWAERILERVEAGEQMDAQAVAMAKSAVRLPENARQEESAEI